MRKIITQSYHKSTDRVDENYSAVVRSTVEEILYQAEVRSRGAITNFRCLDVGSGLGEYAFELERKVLEVVGIEPYEHHYKLFFLSWLPLSMTNLYVRFFQRGNSYEDSAYSKSYFGMRRFLDKFPCVYEFVLPGSSESYFLGCGHKGTFYSFLKRFGIELIRIFPFFWILSKGFIIISKKT